MIIAAVIVLPHLFHAHMGHSQYVDFDHVIYAMEAISDEIDVVLVRLLLHLRYIPHLRHIIINVIHHLHHGQANIYIHCLLHHNRLILHSHHLLLHYALHLHYHHKYVLNTIIFDECQDGVNVNFLHLHHHLLLVNEGYFLNQHLHLLHHGYYGQDYCFSHLRY